MNDQPQGPDSVGSAPSSEESPKRIPLVTFGVAATSVAIFAIGDESFIAGAWDIYDGSFWSLITSAFYHVDFMHLAFNIYWLWVLGRCLEQVVGPIRFMAFFVAAAWVSSAAQLAVSDQTGVGLSGVGYALFGAMWFAQARVPAFQRVIDAQVIGIFLLWLFLCIGLSVVGDASIANTAHVAGLVFGALTGTAALPKRRTAALTATSLLLAASTATLFYAPWSSTWQGLQGSRAQKAEDLDRAIEAYTRSIELDPDDPWGYDARGWVRIESDDFDEAITDFTRALELDPRFARAYSGRGWARSATGDKEGALGDFLWAAELAPDAPSVHEALAMHHYAEGDYRAFVTAMSRAFALGCDNTLYLNSLAWIQVTSTDPGLHDHARSLRVAKRVIEHEPQSGEYQNTLGVALYRNGKWEEARAALRRAMELGNQDPSNLLFIAMCLKQTGKADEARRTYEQALALPDTVRSDEEEYQRFRAEAEALLD